LPAPPTAHPDPAQLAAFAHGRLPEPDATTVESHLDVCEACGSLVDQLQPDPFVSALRHAARLDTPSGCPVDAPTAAFFGDATIPDAEPIPAELAAHPRYRLGALLGRGGMGTVYRAEHTLMERSVAVKVIAPRLLEHPGAVERFKQEVKAAAKLHHPNIVTAFDAEQVGPVTVLVMEFVEGRSLADVLAERGPLPIAEACEYARQAALGLAHAHALGMVHRDVKPHNLMLAADGCVKILDFGLARFVSEGLGDAAPEAVPEPGATTTEGLTGTGTVMGTLDYMAPEQARDTRTADARADVYALGSTLYHLLAGRLPFPGGCGLEKLTRLTSDEPTPLAVLRPDVPSELAAVVVRLMAKRPEERVASAAEAGELLLPFTREAEPPRRARRRWWSALAAAALVAGVVIANAVIKVPTERGELQIETDDPDIEVVVKGDRVVRIRDPKTGREYAIDRQNLTLGELDGDGLQITLDGKTPVVLKRNGEKVASVRVLPKAPPDPAPGGPGADIPGKVWYEGFFDAVWCTGFSNDGKLMISSGWINALWPRDLVYPLRNFGVGGWFTTFSPDDKYLLTSDRTMQGVFLWETATARLVRAYGKPGGRVLYGAVSPDGTMVAAAQWKTLRVWNLADGTELAAIPVYEQSRRPFAFSPDGWRLYAVDPKFDSVTAYDTRTWKPVARFCSSERIGSMALSPDGKALVAESADSVGVVIWGTNAEQPIRTIRLGEKPSPDTERHLAFSANGTRLLHGSSDGTLVLWDTKNWDEIGRWTNQGSVVSVALSPDGTHAFCGCFTDLKKAFLLPLDPPPGKKSPATDQGGIGGSSPVPPPYQPPAMQAGTEARRYLGVTGTAKALAVSRDGKLVAAGGGFPSGDCSLRVWDATTGQHLSTFRGHDAPAVRVAFLGDGSHLVSAGWDGTLRVWTAADGKEVRKIDMPVKRTENVVPLPDGTRVLTVGYDPFVRLWDVKTGKELWKEKAHDGWGGTALAVSADGSRFATAGRGGDLTVRVWDFETRKPVASFKPEHEVFALAFSPDGRTLASGDREGQLESWDASTGKRLVKFGKAGQVQSVAYSESGRLVVTAHAYDSTIRVWDANGFLLAQCAGHRDWVWGAAFLPGERELVTASGGVWREDEIRLGTDHSVRLWRLPDLRQPVELTAARVITDQKTPRALAVSPDGSRAYSSGYDDTIRVCNVATGGEVWRIGDMSRPFDSLALSRDGTKLLSSHRDNTLALWDTATGKFDVELKGHTKTVACVAVSPDGKFALSGGNDNLVRLWDLTTGKELKQLQGHTGPVRAVAFLPGNRAVSGGHDRTVRLWNLDTGTPVRTLGTFSTYVLGLAVTRDGKHVAVASNPSAPLIDVESGTVTRSFNGHTQALHATAVSPDGKLLATGGFDKTVRVWELDTGRCVAVGRGHTEYVVSVAFAGNHTILSAGDNSVRVWELPRPVAPMPRPVVAKPIPAELDLIPRNAAGFVTVPVNEVMTAPSLAWARARVFGGGELAEMVKLTTRLPLDDITRATVIWPTADHLAGNIMFVPPEVPSRVLVLTTAGAIGRTHPEFSRLEFRTGKDTEEYRGRRYLLDGDGWTAFFLADDHTLVIGSRASVRLVIDRLADPKPGPLDAAVRTAADAPHRVVVGIQGPKCRRVLADHLPHQLQLAAPAYTADRVTLALDVRDGLTVDFTADFAAEAAATEGRTALLKACDAGTEFFGGLVTEHDKDKFVDGRDDDHRRDRDFVVQTRDALRAAKPDVTGTRLRLTLRTESTYAFAAALPGMPYLVMPAGPVVQEPADPNDNDKAVARALLAYHAKHGHFPPPAIHDKDGKPLLSWRVAILPHLGDEAAALYKEFKLDDPWDSPANKKLLDRMPAAFFTEPYKTAYRPRPNTGYSVFTAKGSVFEGPGGLCRKEVADDPAETILAVRHADAVPWTRPDGLTFDNLEAVPAAANFVDGTVRALAPDEDPNTLKALATRSGGEKPKPKSAEESRRKMRDDLFRQLDGKPRP